MYKIKEPQPIAPVESTCAPETQGGASRRHGKGPRGPPVCQGPLSPRLFYFLIVSVGDHRPGSRRPPVLSFPAQGCPRERAGPRLARPHAPRLSPSPCGGPPLRHPLFLLKGTDCNPGASTRAPHTPNSGFPQRPGIDRATGHGQGPGLGDMAAGCQGTPMSHPVAKVEPNLGPCPCTLCPALLHGCQRR